MGKVIKGSSPSAGTVTVGVPAFVFVPPVLATLGEARVDATNDALDPTAPTGMERDGALESEAEAQARAQAELAAAAAEAQALIDEATLRAQALVDAADERARDIVAQAGVQGQALVDEVRRSAHEQGYRAGEDAANATMAEMLATLHDLVESARAERHALIFAAEPELVRLAVGIAERVLHQQVALDPNVVVEMAKNAITRVVDREKITVRVNPADIERMREHRDALIALGDVKTMLVIEDQRVDRGGVILETDAGNVDAKISTQLNEVRKILHLVDDVVIGPPPLAAADDALPAARAS